MSVFFKGGVAGIIEIGGNGALSGAVGGSTLPLAELEPLVVLAVFPGFILIGISLGGVGSLASLGFGGGSGFHEETANAQATAARAGMPGSQIIVAPAATIWAVTQRVAMPTNAMLRGKTDKPHNAHRRHTTDNR